MYTAIDPTEHTVSASNVPYYPDAPASGKKYPDASASGKKEPREPRTQLSHPLSHMLGAERKSYDQMRDMIPSLWSSNEVWTYAKAYDYSRLSILREWSDSGPENKRFLEKAVPLLVDFQRRPMKSMKDCLEWSDFLEEAGIGSERYLSWVQKQYELLASAKSKFFEDISLNSFRAILKAANWQDANDESAKVNTYLMKASTSGKPEISFGTTFKWPLALRLNGRCLKVPKADFSTAEFYGVTAINPDILLSIRYVPLGSDSYAQSFLFIPIGNILRLGDWIPHLDKVTTYIYRDPKSQGLDTWSQFLDMPDFSGLDWRITEVVLILRILENGVPGGLYLVRDRELWNTDAGDGNEPINLTFNPKEETLMKVTNMGFRNLRPYGYGTKNRVIDPNIISSSKLEIAQSGVKGQWSEGVPPIGLHSIK